MIFEVNEDNPILDDDHVYSFRIYFDLTIRKQAISVYKRMIIHGKIYIQEVRTQVPVEDVHILKSYLDEENWLRLQQKLFERI